MSQRQQRTFERRESYGAAGQDAQSSLEHDLSFSVRVREETNRTWVAVVGELDLNAADAFDRCLWGAQTPARPTVLDLRGLTFIDSVGLRSVVAARLRSVRWNYQLQVVCAPGQVRRMLSISGFDQLLDIADTSLPRAFAAYLAAA